MNHYFKLQLTLLNRQIIDFGLPPWAGYLLSGLVFVGMSWMLFAKADFAAYIYLFIAFALLLNHGTMQRNEFLKSCYATRLYLKIRLLENACIALPFLVFLIFKQHYLISGLLVLGTGLTTLVNISQGFNFSLPTPFYKIPFEFIVGYRHTYLLVFFTYFLTLMSINVHNFNLGVFSLLLLFLISLSYYADPEDRFYVWIHRMSAKGFLLHKIATGLLHSSLLCLPTTLGLLLFYSEYWAIMLAVQTLGYVYLAFIIVAKYSNFPHKIGIVPSILIGIGLCFPPLLLGIFPFFYKQAVKSLKAELA